MATRSQLRSARPRAPRPPGRLAAVQLYAAAAVVVALLVYVSTLGLIFAAVAVGAAVMITMLAVLGAERMGLLLLVGAFFTAPFYKGVAVPSTGSPVTATDLLFLMAFSLLLPTLMKGRLQLPTLYFIGVAVVFAAGLIASAASIEPTPSLIALTLWMMVMLGLPVGMGLLGPSGRLIDLMVAAFVAGHIFSMGYGIARGYVGQGRHYGLASHPNYFAESGMLALALLIYLGYRYRDRWMLLIVPAAGICGVSVIMSGSRAATVVVAVLVLMVPVVERSAITGFLLAILAALAFFVLPIIAGFTGTGSSIARLAGDDDISGRYSNQARSLHLEDGWDRFLQSPFLGSGLIERFLFEVHNNFLEVAIAIGIFGLAGYLMVLYSFARPLFSLGEYRRLCYGAWAYIGFGATVPGIYDRTIWSVMALSAVAVVEYERVRTANKDRPVPVDAPGRAFHHHPPLAAARLDPTARRPDPESTR